MVFVLFWQFVAEPQKQLDAIFRFLGISNPIVLAEHAIDIDPNTNTKYEEEYSAMVKTDRGLEQHRAMVKDLARRIDKLGFGYSLETFVDNFGAPAKEHGEL